MREICYACDMAHGMARSFQQWFTGIRIISSPSARNRSRHISDAGLTAWCVETSKSAGLVELAKRVKVTWNPRMQTTAGRAWWPDRAIELNPKLRDCAEEEVWRTLKHELAHLFAYERSGRRKIEPHGAEWRAACIELGIAGEQPYHTLPFKRRRMKRNFAYICPNCFTTLRRVRAIRKTVACYECCRRYNYGAYHDRFRLIPANPPR